MSTDHNLSTQKIRLGSVVLRMILGAGIGLAIISFFVFSVDRPNPDWGKYWMIRPLIITPIAAAFGMLFFHLNVIVRPKTSSMRLLVFLLSLLGFVIVLWMGIILGLDGTLWN